MERNGQRTSCVGGKKKSTGGKSGLVGRQEETCISPAVSLVPATVSVQGETEAGGRVNIGSHWQNVNKHYLSGKDRYCKCIVLESSQMESVISEKLVSVSYRDPSPIRPCQSRKKCLIDHFSCRHSLKHGKRIIVVVLGDKVMDNICREPWRGRGSVHSREWKASTGFESLLYSVSVSTCPPNSRSTAYISAARRMTNRGKLAYRSTPFR